MRLEVPGQLGIHHLQHPIDQRKALVHTIHGPANVAGTLVRNELLEARKRLDLAARSVQKRAAEHIHALHVANLLGVIGRRRLGARAARQRVPRHHGGIWAAAKLGQRGRRHPAVDAGFVRIVEPPRDGVEDPGNAVLRDAPPEERIALEGAERVVLDLCVCGRRALSDEVEVDIGAQRGRVEEDQPDVYAQLRL